jgi:hypothetical protein
VTAAKKVPAKKPARQTPAKRAPAKKATAPRAQPARKTAAKKAPATRTSTSRRKPSASPEVEVFEPAYEAHKLRLTGMGWRDVARLTGYADEDTAERSVAYYLSKAAAEMTQEMRQAALRTALDRYDELLQAWWSRALRLNPVAVNGVLKLLAQRAKLEGLEATDETPKTSQTIVITGNSEEYVTRLKALADKPAEGTVIEG